MLEWKRVNNAKYGIAYMMRAEYMANGVPFTFDIVQYEPEGRNYDGEYFVHIRDDKSYIFMVGEGKSENRAKHAAENYLKLVLAGRSPRSVHMWELEVGWESYKKLSTPDFIPVVVNGKLVKSD